MTGANAILLAVPVVLLLAGLMLRWRSRRRAARLPVIVLDGSNVMHWAEGVPRLATVRLVVQELVRRGFRPLVFFDANVGYKVAGRHMSPAQVALSLGMPLRNVVIVRGGQPADPILIKQAIRHRARVVSNDRFMDWRADFSAIRDRRFLIKGRVRGNRVELRM